MCSERKGSRSKARIFKGRLLLVALALQEIFSCVRENATAGIKILHDDFDNVAEGHWTLGVFPSNDHYGIL